MIKKWKVRVEYGDPRFGNQRLTIERVAFAEGPYIAVANCVLADDRRDVHFVTCEEIKPEGA